MIQEAIEKIEELAVAANAAVPCDVGNPLLKAFYLPASEEFRQFTVEPPPLRTTHWTIKGFCEFVNRHVTGAEGQETVYVSADGAVCVIDDGIAEHRTDRITLQAERSVVLNPATFDAAANKGLDQAAFLRLLKATLASCRFDCDLVAAVETIRWRNNDEGSSTRSNAGDAMGRSVRAEVQGVKAPLPDEVTITFPPFPLESSIVDVHIKCTLIVDHESRKFYLIPQPHEIARATNEASALLADEIDSQVMATVVVGKPS